MKGAGLILTAALVILVVDAREPKLGKSKFKPKKGGIQEAFVNWHNRFRRKHRVRDLKYHSDLGAMARNWALHIAYYDLYEHRPLSGSMRYGENIYWLTNVRGKFKINDERRRSRIGTMKSVCTNYSRPYFDSRTAHFTQIVWKATEYVGCGWAHNPQTKVLFVVCNYWQQGNMEGQFRANVL
uniref:Putative scp gapr-1 like scp-like extracellular protein n=2 Tax=Ixodes ricinus TaxID=34613 RepID=V5ID90_IXORI